MTVAAIPSQVKRLHFWRAMVTQSWSCAEYVESLEEMVSIAFLGVTIVTVVLYWHPKCLQSWSKVHGRAEMLFYVWIFVDDKKRVSRACAVTSLANSKHSCLFVKRVNVSSTTHGSRPLEPGLHSPIAGLHRKSSQSCLPRFV